MYIQGFSVTQAVEAAEGPCLQRPAAGIAHGTSPMRWPLWTSMVSGLLAARL
jgi:hypothetical protein